VRVDGELARREDAAAPRERILVLHRQIVSAPEIEVVVQHVRREVDADCSDESEEEQRHVEGDDDTGACEEHPREDPAKDHGEDGSDEERRAEGAEPKLSLAHGLRARGGRRHRLTQEGT